MTIGITLGLAAAFMWSLTNIVDKYLTTKYAPEGNVMGILLLSCFFPGVLLPIAYYYGDVSFAYLDILPLLISGWLMVAWIYFYLRALTLDDASVVMTILVATPVFSLFFGNLILGEWLNNEQLFGSGLILIGAIIVSYKLSGGTGFHYLLLLNAFGAVLVMALMLTLFKFGTSEVSDIWQSLFWRSVGMISAGMFLLVVFTTAADSFLTFILQHSKAGLGFNSINELLTLAGDTLFGIAILFAPIALIQVTESYQPIFILIITIILARVGITTINESITKLDMIRKGVGIGIVVIGSLYII